jgi:hypothetical protein
MKIRASLLVLFLTSTILSFAQSEQSSAQKSATVVARIRLLNQTKVIPPTVVYTPNFDGLFRISAYMVMTVPGQNVNGQWYLQLQWTDDVGPETTFLLLLYDTLKAPGAFALAPPNGPGNTFTFVATANQPISFGVTDVGSGAEGTWDVVFTIERLGPA